MATLAGIINSSVEDYVFATVRKPHRVLRSRTIRGPRCIRRGDSLWRRGRGYDRKMRTRAKVPVKTPTPPRYGTEHGDTSKGTITAQNARQTKRCFKARAWLKCRLQQARCGSWRWSFALDSAFKCLRVMKQSSSRDIEKRDIYHPYNENPNSWFSPEKNQRRESYQEKTEVVGNWLLRVVATFRRVQQRWHYMVGFGCQAEWQKDASFSISVSLLCRSLGLFRCSCSLSTRPL